MSMQSISNLRETAAAGSCVSPYLHELAGRWPAMPVRCEFAVTGACLYQPKRVAEVRPLLEPDMFSDPVARSLFAILAAMYDAHEPIDLTTYMDYVAKHELSELIEGFGTPIYAQSMCAAPANARFYAMQVRKAHATRASASACADAVAQMSEGETDVAEVVNALQNRFAEVADLTTAHDGPSISELADGIMQRWDAEPDRVNTPWPVMTDIVMGWERQTLVVIGAAPSVGKTAMMTQIARSAIAQNQPTLFVSLEMSEEAITARLVSQISNVAYRQVISGDMPQQEARSVGEALAWLNGTPLTIRTPKMCNAGAISALIRSFPNTRIVCVDYMQLIAGEGDNRAQQIGNVVHTLKRAAVECDCTVIAASQLNRATFDTASSKPELHNLRESGDIEAAADIVILLWRDRDELSEHGRVRRYCRVAKNRNGPIGNVPMVFDLRGARWDQNA